MVAGDTTGDIGIGAGAATARDGETDHHGGGTAPAIGIGAHVPMMRGTGVAVPKVIDVTGGNDTMSEVGVEARTGERGAGTVEVGMTTRIGGGIRIHGRTPVMITRLCKSAYLNMRLGSLPRIRHVRLGDRP